MKYALIALVVLLSGCSTRNLDDTKLNACDTWAKNGYTCVGYEGYEYGVSGAKVWYTLKNDSTPGVIYSGYVQKFGDEYHIYGPRVINAILTK